MNETIKQVLLSSFMRNSRSLVPPEKHHKRGQMQSHHVQTGETDQRPNRKQNPDPRPD